jgi:hypothetical protein
MKRYLLAIGLIACDAGKPPAAKQAPPSRPAVQIVVDAAIVDAMHVVAPAAVVEPPAAVVDPLEKYFLLGPMATRDGKRVLIPVSDDDSARALPNLTLEVRDRSDKVIERVVLLALEEELDDKQRTERAAAAERLLAKHELEPLMPNGNDSDHFAVGTSITWQRGRFSISYASDVLVERAIPMKWRGTTYYDKREGITCKNPDFLNNAWFNVSARIAVVEVAYRGNDTCWAPSRQRHVVAW